jgi:hypothetical protein
LVELIESYDFGRITINGIVYTKDVIITGEKTMAGWMRKEGLCCRLMSVPEEAKLYFQRKGIELLVEKTRKACDIFNVLSGTKRTLAALHLTC